VSSERRGSLQFIGVANLIVCGLFVILSLPFFMGQIRVLRSWPVTDARVIDSQIVTVPTTKHDQLYAAKLKIRYAVDGNAITADLTSFQSKDYEETQHRAAEFPVGSHRDIRYDPNNPEQARIGAGWNRHFFAVPLITLGCGLSFGLLALGFFVAARFGARPSQSPS
jgi:hypothetical protein